MTVRAARAGNGREYLGGALKVSEGWRIDKFAIY